MNNIDLVAIQNEVNKDLGNKETFDALILTTFKGLSPQSVKRAMFEGYMRGFKFKDFLEKNIYAIKYGDGYSLVTSIDYARKIGAKSGITGKSEPVYKDNPEGKNVTCSVTVEKTVDGKVGKYTATVYLSEYNTGRNLWTTKPRTMIAKVAEMHALRMACPEELAQSYIEEEVTKEVEKPPLDIEPFRSKLLSAKNLSELLKVWSPIPVEAKKLLENEKNSLKEKFTPPPKKDNFGDTIK